METKTTKETLEKGVVISKEGGIREFKSFQNVLEGELAIIFSPDGVKSILRRRSSPLTKSCILVSDEGVSFEKTVAQVQIESVLTHFYYVVLPMEKKIKV